VGNPFNGFEIGKNLKIMFDTKKWRNIRAERKKFGITPKKAHTILLDIYFLKW
jgi:hypothetical protein